MEMGDTGARIDRENEQKVFTRKRLQIGRWNERDGDGRHGRVHACNAAHHGCDGLGPVHSERMNDNE